MVKAIERESGSGITLHLANGDSKTLEEFVDEEATKERIIQLKPEAVHIYRGARARFSTTKERNKRPRSLTRPEINHLKWKEQAMSALPMDEKIAAVLLKGDEIEGGELFKAVHESYSGGKPPTRKIQLRFSYLRGKSPWGLLVPKTKKVSQQNYYRLAPVALELTPAELASLARKDGEARQTLLQHPAISLFIEGKQCPTPAPLPKTDAPVKKPLGSPDKAKITEAIGEALGKALGVKVEVSGSIEIRFTFGNK